MAKPQLRRAVILQQKEHYFTAKFKIAFSDCFRLTAMAHFQLTNIVIVARMPLFEPAMDTDESLLDRRVARLDKNNDPCRGHHQAEEGSSSGKNSTYILHKSDKLYSRNKLNVQQHHCWTKLNTNMTTKSNISGNFGSKCNTTDIYSKTEETNIPKIKNVQLFKSNSSSGLACMMLLLFYSIILPSEYTSN